MQLRFSKTTGLAVMAAAAIVAGADLLASAPAAATPPAADRAEIEKIIREYLLANPEVIFEAADAYRAKQEASAISKVETALRQNLASLMAAESGHAIGASAKDAKVLVIEFFDYHCGYCRQATDFVLGLPGEYKDVRIVLQDLPIIHPKSGDTALWSAAFAGTPDYVRLHKALMAASGTLTDARVISLAATAGVDTTAAARQLGDPAARARLQARIDASRAIAAAMQIDGTPNFVVASADGQRVRVVPGYSAEAVREAIAAVRG